MDGAVTDLPTVIGSSTSMSSDTRYVQIKTTITEPSPWEPMIVYVVTIAVVLLSAATMLGVAVAVFRWLSGV